MSARHLLCASLLVLTACPSFAVGPEAYARFERDDSTCEEAGLGPAPCSRFDVDNGPLTTDSALQPVRLSLGFETSERNLARVTLSYERPGAAAQQLPCAFGRVEAPDEPASPQTALRCRAVVLAGTPADEVIPLDGLDQGILEIDVDLRMDTPGPHALSAWLTDDNDFDSPTVRWPFSVSEPDRG